MLGYYLFGRERRQSYSVHERPDPASDRVDRAEALVFVRDGFTGQAFVLPAVWLAGQGIWMGVLAYVAAAAAILGLASLIGLPPILPVLAFLALHAAFGFEADEMLRAHLTTKGWATVGHVTGTGTLDCERRFFDQWLASVPMKATGITNSVVASTAPSVAPSVVPTATQALRGTAAATTRPRAILGNLLAPLRRADKA